MTDPRERKVIHVGAVADDDDAAPRASARERLLDHKRAGERAPSRASDDASEAGAGALDDAPLDDDRLDADHVDGDAVDTAAIDDDAPSTEADDDELAAHDEELAADDDEPLDDDEPELSEARYREARPPQRRRRSPWTGPAPMLLLGATVLWGSVLALRCRPGGELPPTALPEPTARDTEPDAADAAPRIDDSEPAPIPMGDRTAQPDEPDQGAPDGPDAAVPEPRDDWPAGLEIPDTIRYTIRRGGSLENVANLFKIYHHEILAMNPGIGLEQNLAPNTRIVVYQRDPEVASESIGFPSDGSLAGAMPMVEGKGRRIMAIPWKTWGTTSTIALLDRVLDRWSERPDAQTILVGNISNRTGGRLEPHSTHQSGRDVDLGYPQKLASGAELSWQEMNERNLDAAETWALLRMLVETRAVEEIYIDRSLQKLLHEHAIATGVVPKSSLARWMEYPRPTGHSGTVIKHVAGHTDHLHVRFACDKGQPRCKSR